MHMDREGKTILIHTSGRVCTTGREVVESVLYCEVVRTFWAELREQRSPLLDPFPKDWQDDPQADAVVTLMRSLSERSLEDVVQRLAGAVPLLADDRRIALLAFVEALYDFWRGFDRFMVFHAMPEHSLLESRPYRAFSATIEVANAAVRTAYRDVCENVRGAATRVYRQLPAACNVGVVAMPRALPLPPSYARVLEGIPLIRLLWMAPPLLLDPPSNKRSGAYQKVDTNPLDGVVLSRERWLCFPARVGSLVILAYFHPMYAGLGSALASLFEIAADEQLDSAPDALFVFGVPPASLGTFGDSPLVIHDDEANHLVVAALPAKEQLGYFGYLKKTMLTLHNIVMMKRGRLPFHGAMMHVELRSGATANIVVIGDTGTGKSETIEALQSRGASLVRDLRIIADDMGSLALEDGHLVAYGTEIGAFVRLDDLDKGYAFARLDRAVLMSPHRTNARVVLPITTLHEVLKGRRVDIMLYANNFEPVDGEHPVIERFPGSAEALAVFSEGAAMAKGTTAETGLQRNHFANIFGPPLYRELHQAIATEFFEAAVRADVFVGQVRTRLAQDGMSQAGPAAAADALLELVERGVARSPIRNTSD